MLALSVKPGQRVLVEVGGQRIWVVLLESRAGRVRLGFDGPREVGVWREAVWREMGRDGEEESR